MQIALAFPEGIHIPGLPAARTGQRTRAAAVRSEWEPVELPDLDVRELSILTLKQQRGRK